MASASLFPPLVPFPSLTFQLYLHLSGPVCGTYFSKSSVLCNKADKTKEKEEEEM